MIHTCAQNGATVIAALKALDWNGPAELDERIAPGFYLSWDADNSEVTFKARSEPGRVLDLEAEITGEPNWCSLNIALGAGTFRVGDTLGCVAQLESGTPTALELSLLSVSEDEVRHLTEWKEHITTDGSPQIVSALHTVQAYDAVLDADHFHTLIVSLPRKNFQLKLKDLAFFVVPHDAPAHPQPVKSESAS